MVFHSSHPILFNADMVRAILRDRDPKTQTRRVCKPQPGEISHRHASYEVDGIHYSCPYGDPGDTLWVRESWVHECSHCNNVRCGNPAHIYYPATDIAPDTFPKKFVRPSIHMPRWASRITLGIVHVRIERVQDISYADCFAEGLRADCEPLRLIHYENLWNLLNAERGYGWDVNPWVWVIRFRLLNEDGDFMQTAHHATERGGDDR